MRRGWASRTAIWVSAWRGIAEFDDPAITRDPIAKRLVPLGWRLALEAAARRPRVTRAALALAAVATGGLSRHLPYRTRAIDDAIHEEHDRGTRQLVLLGAGLDARAHRLDVLSDVTVFEVDHPDTQAHKRDAVRDLAPRAKDVRYVSVDFSRDDLTSELSRAGHDPSAPTIFVWEGVTMYLPRPALDATLEKVRDLSAPGSCLLVTYYSTRQPPLAALAHPVFAMVGEPLLTRFAPGEARALLAAHAFTLETDEGDDEWGQRWFGKHPRWNMSERLARARRT